MSKTLVAYFSASGVTKSVAERLAKTAGADLFEIEPAKPYTAADLNWNDKNSRSTLEANDPTCRPAIASKPLELDEYSTIYLGFPIWWYVAPAIIKTFMESQSFAGKKIVLFATSDGSGMGKTAKVLEASAPGATIVPGAILNGASDAELKHFVERNRS